MGFRAKPSLRQGVSTATGLLPRGIGRQVSTSLNTAINALPEIPEIPTPNIPLPNIRGLVQQIESVLPASAPKISGFIPGRTTKTSGAPGTNVDSGFRELDVTSTKPAGSVKTGGYRSI